MHTPSREASLRDRHHLAHLKASSLPVMLGSLQQNHQDMLSRTQGLVKNTCLLSRESGFQNFAGTTRASSMLDLTGAYLVLDCESICPEGHAICYPTAKNGSVAIPHTPEKLKATPLLQNVASLHKYSING
ncbi:hypothetical protein E4T39_01740 [Aureobasidium subglaciale]|nr:hypothetical protein E4T39_01740 [Aureobasidium subglaciale]